MQLTTRLVAAGITGALAAAAIGSAAPATPVRGATTYAATSAHDRTSAAEKRRVDGVPTPRIGWFRCYGSAECATDRLPLDYDEPAGATTEIAVLRVRARKPKARIGTLFVNPGGPGGLGTEFAYAAPYFLGDDLLDRFDVVGFDPRGIGFSANLRCFRSAKDQTGAYAGLGVAFPYGGAQEAAYQKSAGAIGRGCSSTGRPLSGAMSTAEAARDMDVLRRAVGDPELSYLGFSYGTALGQYYAAMFPDRVRAIAVDGVIDPVSWTGTGATRNLGQDDRLRSSDGAHRALTEILRRCDKAGLSYCPFAEGNSVREFDALARSLRKKPVVVRDADFGSFTVTYADFVAIVLGALYSPYAGDSITALAADLRTLTSGTASRRVAARAVAGRLAARQSTPAGRDFPYDNGFETFSGVACTDGLHPTAAGWPSRAAAADRRAPYFGRAWAWNTAQCARDVWKVRDEDAYRGPFDRRTAAPVLVVGSFWDPATNYAQAAAAARLLPNSRLLASDNWGHTGYGTSACVTGAVDVYLLRGALPAAGAVCVGDVQPFREPVGAATESTVDPRAGRAPESMSELIAGRAPARGQAKRLPPVTLRLPAALRGS